MRPIIHSTKHYIQKSLATVVGGAVDTTTLIHAVSVASKDIATEVEEGATVKAIYLEMWARSGEAAVASSGQFIVYKSSGDMSGASAADMAALNGWDNKKNILYTTMGLINDNASIASPLFKGWIKIPRGKQRFGLNDKLFITFFPATIDWHVCGFATYKEYT